jgi:copper oxidase (laccase) domain-containing protein
MMLGSSLLAAVPGLRHAFFTCEGGVSDGVYASLNGGPGSSDDPARVARTARAWQANGRDARSIPHPAPDPLARCGGGVRTMEGATKADAIVTRTEGLSIGVTGRLRADPVGRSRARASSARHMPAGRAR